MITIKMVICRVYIYRLVIMIVYHQIVLPYPTNHVLVYCILSILYLYLITMPVYPNFRDTHLVIFFWHGRTLQNASQPKPGKSFTSLEPSGVLSLLSTGSQWQHPTSATGKKLDCIPSYMPTLIHIYIFIG